MELDKRWTHIFPNYLEVWGGSTLTQVNKWLSWLSHCYCHNLWPNHFLLEPDFLPTAPSSVLLLFVSSLSLFLFYSDTFVFFFLVFFFLDFFLNKKADIRLDASEIADNLPEFLDPQCRSAYLWIFDYQTSSRTCTRFLLFLYSSFPRGEFSTRSQFFYFFGILNHLSLFTTPSSKTPQLP